MSTKPHIRVGAALITQEGQYLITRRKSNVHLGGLWEFPGGKCEAKESLEDCVRREVLEELDFEVTQPVYLMSHVHEYPEKTVDLYFFECSIYRGQPKAADCADFRWVSAGQLCDYEFPPADRPLIDFLLKQTLQKS